MSLLETFYDFLVLRLVVIYVLQLTEVDHCGKVSVLFYFSFLSYF